MSSFKTLKVPSLKEICTQEILNKILSGELKPGDRLPSERELAELMGVSRSSVNHSIMELEAMGFLVITPRRGTIVRDYRKEPTPSSLAAVMNYSNVEMEKSLFSDLMDTRLLIEVESAKLACSNIYDSTFEKMKKLVDELAKKPEDPTELIYRFHYLLTLASGNSIYSMIYRGFESVLCTMIRQHYCLRNEDVEEAARLHQDLLDAIERKDEALAMEKVKKILIQGIIVLEERYK